MFVEKTLFAEEEKSEEILAMLNDGGATYLSLRRAG